MITAYNQYQHISAELEWFINRMNDLRYKYYASDLFYSLMHSPGFPADTSVRKAMAIMRLLNLPVQEHVTAIYRSDGAGISRDWRLSELACSLVILVSDDSVREIDEAQQALIQYLGI